MSGLYWFRYDPNSRHVRSDRDCHGVYQSAITDDRGNSPRSSTGCTAVRIYEDEDEDTQAGCESCSEFDYHDGSDSEDEEDSRLDVNGLEVAPEDLELDVPDTEEDYVEEDDIDLGGVHHASPEDEDEASDEEEPGTQARAGETEAQESRLSALRQSDLDVV